MAEIGGDSDLLTNGTFKAWLAGSGTGQGGPAFMVAATPVLSIAGAYADGNVLFDWTAIAAALTAGDSLLLQSLTIIDKDDEGSAVDIYSAIASTTLGSLRAAPTMTDAQAVASQVQRVCQFGSGDFTDLGGFRIATISGLALPIPTTTTSFYLAGIARAAVTYTAVDDMVLLAGLVRR